MEQAHAKAPGKLYIAGEYAVVEPGHPAVIVAVDRFIDVSLSPSEKPYGTIYSSQLSSETLCWERTGGNIELEKPNSKADILIKTIGVTEHYLNEQAVDLPYYDLTVTSSLDSKDGRKYGLGSSGAVTVAAIRAILESAGIALSNEHIFKLAAVTHMCLHSRGSFGDLAAATYTGWLAYASMDKKWLENQLESQTLTSVLESQWPHLRIEQLPSPHRLELLIGWTGIPASTESYVSSVQTDQSEITYQDFITQSKECVEDLISGLKMDDPLQIAKAIRLNRQLLLEMSKAKNIVLETPLLKALTFIAEKYDAASKTSGAGGGDCGIAFIDSPVQKEQISLEWRANKIEPLALNVYDKSNS